ncbi:MAG: efflux RND transporter periplasmic adaptor subunit [Xanthomonadales bacterium]|jgi:HlyD family secretion protein|nr:efflux RND transporter periplasmic adaptor subunit [Xanthomonadales bacterium]
MRKLLIFAGIAVALAALIALSRMNQGDEADAVDVAEAERKLIRSSVLASGALTYREQVKLGSEVIARVIAVHVEEGDPVEKGQLLISLETDNLTAQLEQADARVRMQQIAIDRQKLMVRNLARRYGNQKELLDRELVDEDSVENLAIELNMAEVDLRSQEEGLAQARAARAQAADLLSKTSIVSPIDGIVIQGDVKVGETVIAGTTNLPGSTLMVVADTSEMLVEVRVDEADIAQIAEGQAADIFTAAFPDDPIRGVVESIATTARQTAGQQSLSFLVKVVLDADNELPVRSGMSARADIYTQSTDETLAVPIQAIRYDEEAESEDSEASDQPFVMLFDDGVARRQDVEIGLSSDSDQEITEGLEEGARVIIGPYRVLRVLDDGDPVREADPDDAEADAVEPADFD